MEKPGLKRENQLNQHLKKKATARKAHTLQLVKRDRSMFNFQNFSEKTKPPDNNSSVQKRFVGLRYQKKAENIHDQVQRNEKILVGIPTIVENIQNHYSLKVLIVNRGRGTLFLNDGKCLS